MKYLSRLAALLFAMVLFACGAAAEMLPLAVTADDYLLGAGEANEAVTALYEDFMSSSTLEELYVQKMLPAVNGDGLVLMMEFSEAQIAAVAELANELYAKIEEPTQEDIYDLEDCILTLNMLKNGGDAVAVYGSWADDTTINANNAINSPVTIANNDNGGEANWSFNNGTLTINATVTIPQGQSLDILVANGDTDKKGKIVAGTALGNSPMFIVEGKLKIAKTTNNDGQNYGSIEINGGKIQVNSSGTLEMEDIATVSGTATWEFAAGSKVNIYGDVPVSGNLSVEGEKTNIVRRYPNDAMFKVGNNASLSITGVIIDGENKQFEKAVIEVPGKNTATVTVINTTFKNCESTSGGSAAIHFASDSKFDLKVEGCEFDNCISVSGAAIYFSGYAKGSAMITHSTFKNCTTEEGGVIRTNGAGGVLATVKQCLFKNNKGTKTDSHGGAIYWNACGTHTNGTTAKMIITDCQFIENSTGEYGGAVFNESFMEIGTEYTSDFTQNETTPGQIRGTLIKGNKATYGGGVQVPTYGGGMEPHNGVGATLSLGSGVFIIGNEATYGGGLAMRVGKGTIGNTPEQIATVQFKININGAVIRDNKATIMGGGIYLDRMNGFDLYPSEVNLNSGQITGNKAPRGGAVCVYNENQEPSTKTNIVNIGSVNGDLIIEDNEANGDSALGGAVYVSYGNVAMRNGTVKENNAKLGGAICVENGQYTMSSGTLQNNTATENGGAVYVTGGNFTMTGGTIADNTAANNGGAAYVTGGNFTMNNGTISGNGINNDDTVVTKNGGAVYVSGGTFTMNNGTFSGNKATTNGGAVYVTKSGTAKSDFVMNNGTITGSNALSGGAAYVSGGDFTMTNGTITGNTATDNGGAIYLSGGNFKMEHGTVTENSAYLGGAVYLAGDANTTFTMESGVMSNNKATDDGGAVYATSGTMYIGLEKCPGEDDQSMHTKLGAGRHHPLLQENEAGDCGGGLAIADEGEVYFYCGSATNNEALYKGVGMNIFMTGGNFYLYDGAQIGVPRDPDLVIIGGTLHDMCVKKEYLKLYYYTSNADDAQSLEGLVEEAEWFNLPDGEYLFRDYKPEDEDGEPMIFVGWTAQGAASGAANEFVRSEDQYLASGKSIIAVDSETFTDGGAPEKQPAYDGTADKMMHLYALWAPATSEITYVSYLEGVGYTEMTHTPATYFLKKGIDFAGYKETIHPVEKPGYAINKWYIYQNEGQNANWGTDYEPVYKAGTTEKTYANLELSSMKVIEVDPYTSMDLLIGQMRFGDITLIANYIPMYSDLTIVKQDANLTLDPNHAFIFNVVGTPLDGSGQIDMQVVINGNGQTKIARLPVGTYTITEMDAWSWRYTATSKVGEVATNQVTLITPDDPQTITFTNTRGKTKWLDGNAETKENNFNAVSSGSSGSTTKALSLDAEEELYFVPTYH